MRMILRALVLTFIAAGAFAANVLPACASFRRRRPGILRGLAGTLNERGVRTARGGIWHNSTVRNLLAREAAVTTR